jgi:hypothetical protein
MATFLGVSAAEPTAVNSRGIMSTRTRNFLIYSINTFSFEGNLPIETTQAAKGSKKATPN